MKKEVPENPESDFHFGRNGSNMDFKLLDEDVLLKKTFETDPRQGCEILFQKYYPLLCSHAVRLVYSKEVAEDLVSELFCKFWRDEIYLTINTSYRAYLFKAVRFSSYNYIKWELGKSVKVEQWDTYLDFSNTFKPEETLLFEELAKEIEQIIENLPKQCKRVFILSRFENKKYREIAEEMGISLKSVEAHISKALDVLRKNLKSSGLASILVSCFHYGI
jgi:RNA polymerase sigma-70 factor (family 1)